MSKNTMSTLWIFIILSFLMISVLCLTPDEIEAQRSGWNIDPTTQYHIQTDEGPERYFRYQTLNGQFRKEKRLEDGTVIGTEGWLDPQGFLRIKDYIADNKGFRILKSKKVFVGRNSPIEEAVAVSRRVPAQSGILSKPRRPPNPFRQPAIQDLSSNGIDSDSTKPYRRYNNPTSTEYPSYYSSTIAPITLEETYNEIPKPVSSYLAPTYQYQSPYSRRYRRPTSYSTPSIQVLPPTDSINNKFKNEIGINVDPVSNYGLYRPETRYYRAAIASGKFNSTARQIRGRNKTNQPIVRSDSSNNNNNSNKNNSSSSRSSNNQKRNGDSPIYYIKPRARQARYSQAASSLDEELPEYDGTHTNANGFQYYLKTHYHEEEQKPDGTVGPSSFGYVDPFGIRRVVYYKADENGFVHKKNNRYVGFNSTPYDPLPPRSK